MGLVDSFDGAGPTGGTTYTFSTSDGVILLLGRDEAATVRTGWVLALVFLAVSCTPVIDQVFTHEWFAAVGATGSYMLAVTFRMIRRSFVQLETGVADGLMAGGADEVIRVPCCAERGEIAAPDGLATLFADWC